MIILYLTFGQSDEKRVVMLEQNIIRYSVMKRMRLEKITFDRESLLSTNENLGALGGELIRNNVFILDGGLHSVRSLGMVTLCNLVVN